MTRTQMPFVALRDPVFVAYTHLSTNVDNERDEQTVDGFCLRCGTRGQVFVVRDVVSSRFTDWEHQQSPVGDLTVGWCRVCAWAYRTPENRTTCLWISSNSAYRMRPPELAKELHHPVPEDTAISVPMGRRKHVLPHTEWSFIRTDHTGFMWGPAEVELLETFNRLRDVGVTSKEFHNDAPPYRLITQGTNSWMFDDWTIMRSRHTTPAWPLAEWLTRNWKQSAQ